MSSLGIATLVPNNGKCPAITARIMTSELLHHIEHFTHGYLVNRDSLKAKDYIAQIAYALRTHLLVIGSKLLKNIMNLYHSQISCPE